jgi:hypothetical protein
MYTDIPYRGQGLGGPLEPYHFIGVAKVAIGLAATDGRVWGWLRGRRVRGIAPELRCS